MILLLIYIFASILRFLLFSFKIDEFLEWLPELSTHLTKWKALKESLFLNEIGVGMYSGNSITQPPLLLFFFQQVDSLLDHLGIKSNQNLIYNLFFISLDLLIAHLLSQIGEKFQKTKEYEKDEQKNHKIYLSYILALAYLFNPWSIAGKKSQLSLFL